MYSLWHMCMVKHMDTYAPVCLRKTDTCVMLDKIFWQLCIVE